MFNSELVEEAKTKYEKAGKKQETASGVFLKSVEKLYDTRLSGVCVVKEVEDLVNTIKATPVSWNTTFSEISDTYRRLGIELDKYDAKQGEINKEFVLEAAGTGVSAALTGLGVGALAPTAAMAVATTFGVASTGTAISALSGAAATNAALAWLGGGALAAGGGGVVAGNALLAMAGPIGWSIAGALIVGGGVLAAKKKGNANKELASQIIAETLKVEKRTVEFKLLSKETKELEKSTGFIIGGLKNDYRTAGVLTKKLKDFRKMPKETQELLCKLVNTVEALCELLKKVPGEE